MASLTGVYDSILEWADGLGLAGLAIISSTEAAFQPIPPDLIVWPMVLAADSNAAILAIVLVATIASVIGAIGGYGIGMYAGTWILERFVSENTITKLNALIERYGAAGVFIAAVSPIPYKALAWIAGAGKMDFRLFIAAGLFGRGIRFGLAGVLLGIYGESMKSYLDWKTFTAISLIGAVLIIPLFNWWQNLAISKKTEDSIA